jgi:cytochrome c
MFRFPDRAVAFAGALALTLAVALPSARAADDFAGVGRAATPAEIAAWDIDVRPDFKGLPKGSGSVARGEELWEAKCAVCHGTFGESNKVFSPLVGGVEKGDLETGHVAALKRTDFPARTTLMKVATISTLYDYIRRAMPWNAPKSLSDDDVYAVLAYLLNLSDIVPSDFVLDDQTIRDVQKIMPNRNGMTWNHGLWPSAAFSGKPVGPDVKAERCMKACRKEAEVASLLPDHALASHGNLADQNRKIGQVRGIVTGPSEASAPERPKGAAIADAAGCLGCHAVDSRLVGPSYAEVAAKYKGTDATARLLAKIRAGGEGVWGSVAMPPQEDIKDADLAAVVAWILDGAPQK